MTTEKKPPPKPEPERTPSWSPADDIFGKVNKPVDTDLDLDHGSFSKPPPKP